MGSFLTTVKVAFHGFFRRVKDNLHSFFRRVKEKLQTKYKLDVNQVVQDYDDFLQYPLVTTASFQDILDVKLNQTKRAFQLIIMLYFCLVLIPRYFCLCVLYFQDCKTRLHYQYILADYCEEMGLFGRTFNVASLTFTFGVFLNCIVIRKFEGQGSLEFLTDWLKRVPKMRRIENADEHQDEIRTTGDLDNESRYKLISYLHYKLIFTKITGRIISNGVQSVGLIAFPLFIYKKRPSFLITCLGLWNCITMVVCIEISTHHYYSLYLSYVVTTDYFKLVINNIIRKVDRT